MVEERLGSAKYKIVSLRVRVFVYCLLEGSPSWLKIK